MSKKIISMCIFIFGMYYLFLAVNVKAASNISIYDIDAYYVATEKFDIIWTTNGSYDCTVIYSLKDGNLDDDGLVATRDADDYIFGSNFSYANSSGAYYYKLELTNQGDSIRFFNGNKAYYNIMCYDQDRNKTTSSVNSINIKKISNVETKNITANSATVEWNSNLPDVSYILYGTVNSDDLINQVAKDSASVISHKLLISSLSPGTKYYFKIYTDTSSNHLIESTVYSFTTSAKIATYQGTNLKVNKKTYQANEKITLELWSFYDNVGEYPVDIWLTKNLTQGAVEKKLLASAFNVSGHSFKEIDIANTSYFSNNGSGEYTILTCKVNACTETIDGKLVFNSNSSPDSTFTVTVSEDQPKVCAVCVGGTDTGKIDSNGCKIYLCQETSLITEKVKCWFKGSQTEQKCYAAVDNNGLSCSGKESCIMDVTRTKGEKITWKSSCGGYAYTTMDGTGGYDGRGEYAEFDCAVAATTTTTTPAPRPIESKVEIIEMQYNAKDIFNNKYDSILAELKQLRDTIKEQQNEIKYLKSMTADLRNVSEAMKGAINDFITYGVDANTVKLGAGERAAVISSYKAAFAKLPETEAELTDAIKIANGRFPSVTSDIAEKEAKEQFIKIYKRVADLNDANDNAAIKVMAYGLRQKAKNRNLNSEKSGIKTFKAIYGYTPKTTEDWNTMQAITYSGAAREKDSDGDLLSDEMEAQYGTNPKKADTDGDGFKDGVEVNTGYNPKGAGKLYK